MGVLKMKRLSILLLTAFALTMPALADETWDTQIGTVYYAEEINGYAIFNYPTSKSGIEGMAYIKDLAGNFENRVGTYDGYWVEPETDLSGPGCDVLIVDEKGQAYSNWGRLKVVFTEKSYPSGWIAMGGDCFDEPSEALIAKPLLGEAAGEAQDALEAKREAAQRN